MTDALASPRYLLIGSSVRPKPDSDDDGDDGQIRVQATQPELAQQGDNEVPCTFRGALHPPHGRGFVWDDDVHPD